MTVIIRGSEGLRTQPDRSRLAYMEGVGLRNFSACMNVIILDGNQIMMRRGILKKVPENAHSLFGNNDFCLFGADDGLWLLLPGFAGYSLMATVTPSMRISYVMVDGIIYWANGAQKGKIVDGVNQPWVKSDTVYSNAVSYVLHGPPIGKRLAYYRGRMYAVTGNWIPYSEEYGPDIWPLGKAYLSLESEVTMCRPVAGGIYISDSEKTYFASGSNPAAFDWKSVDNFPALPWSDVNAMGAMQMSQNGEMVWTPGGKTEVAFWLTNNGIMFGDAGGNVTCLTEERIDLLPPYTSGAILIDGSMLTAQFIK